MASASTPWQPGPARWADPETSGPARDVVPKCQRSVSSSRSSSPEALRRSEARRPRRRRPAAARAPVPAGPAAARRAPANRRPAVSSGSWSWRCSTTACTEVGTSSPTAARPGKADQLDEVEQVAAGAPVQPGRVHARAAAYRSSKAPTGQESAAGSPPAARCARGRGGDGGLHGGVDGAVPGAPVVTTTQRCRFSCAARQPQHVQRRRVRPLHVVQHDSSGCCRQASRMASADALAERNRAAAGCHGPVRLGAGSRGCAGPAPTATAAGRQVAHRAGPGRRMPCASPGRRVPRQPGLADAASPSSTISQPGAGRHRPQARPGSG